MRRSTLKQSVVEAARFIRRAELVLKTTPPEHDSDALGEPSRSTAALRRASMDLTRSLADLRAGRAAELVVRER